MPTGVRTRGNREEKETEEMLASSLPFALCNWLASVFSATAVAINESRASEKVKFRRVRNVLAYRIDDSFLSFSIQVRSTTPIYRSKYDRTLNCISTCSKWNFPATTTRDGISVTNTELERLISVANKIRKASFRGDHVTGKGREGKRSWMTNLPRI